MLPPLPHRQISDSIYRANLETSAWSFRSLQYSITICPAVGFIGGLFYLVAVLYVNDDRKAVLHFLEGSPNLVGWLMMAHRWEPSWLLWRPL